MQASVILAHPDPTSFNHAIAETVVSTLSNAAVEVNFHDLYRERFEPLLPSEEIPRDVVLPESIETHCREIRAADLITIIHPNWWGQPPAILKGWVDRVIRPGVAYEFLEGDSGEGIPAGLLRAKQALVFNTSNTEAVREQELFGDPVETIWKNCIFGLCGVSQLHRRTFSIVVTSGEETRRGWLTEVAQLVEDSIGLASKRQ